MRGVSNNSWDCGGNESELWAFGAEAGTFRKDDWSVK